jgi:hypothetical protein
MLWQPSRKTVNILSEDGHLPIIQKGEPMNRIIYLVGLVVIVLLILGFFGLR